MQDRLAFEVEFRLNRLSVRLERLARHFEQLSSSVKTGNDAGDSLQCLHECKMFIEWTGIDLDIDSAYGLMQMQRQLVQWQRGWGQVWGNLEERSHTSQTLKAWATQVREMAGILV